MTAETCHFGKLSTQPEHGWRMLTQQVGFYGGLPSTVCGQVARKQFCCRNRCQISIAYTPWIWQRF